ncbi:hypothetical protein, partial [Streptomyces sp. NPDC053726]|uniref:hypothetical protein n=1 Tax=Streptomyces sp. NPDC053726 TaxID=3365713 RepID=UPI0037D84539
MAVAEENLLGQDAADYAATQPEGYSSALHEAAHMVFSFGLADGQRERIGRFHQERAAAGPATEWIDGPLTDTDGQTTGNYASHSPQEYFAQSTVGYFGANYGTDPHSGQPRNNGSHWVQKNDPGLFALFEDLWGPVGGQDLEANTRSVTHRDETLWEAPRDHTAVTEITPTGNSRTTEHDTDTTESGTLHPVPQKTAHDTARDLGVSVGTPVERAEDGHQERERIRQDSSAETEPIDAALADHAAARGALAQARVALETAEERYRNQGEGSSARVTEPGEAQDALTAAENAVQETRDTLLKLGIDLDGLRIDEADLLARPRLPGGGLTAAEKQAYEVDLVKAINSYYRNGEHLGSLPIKDYKEGDFNLGNWFRSFKTRGLRNLSDAVKDALENAGIAFEKDTVSGIWKTKSTNLRDHENSLLMESTFRDFYETKFEFFGYLPSRDSEIDGFNIGRWASNFKVQGVAYLGEEMKEALRWAGINFSLVDGKWKTTSPAWGHGWGSRRVVEAIGSYYRGGNDFGSPGGLPARDHVEDGFPLGYWFANLERGVLRLPEEVKRALSLAGVPFGRMVVERKGEFVERWVTSGEVAAGDGLESSVAGAGAGVSGVRAGVVGVGAEAGQKTAVLDLEVRDVGEDGDDVLGAFETALVQAINSYYKNNLDHVGRSLPKFDHEENGFKLGSWFSNFKTRGLRNLPDAVKDALENAGITFEKDTASGIWKNKSTSYGDHIRSLQMESAFRDFYEENFEFFGHLPSRDSEVDGFNIGKWASNFRIKGLAFLGEEMKEALRWAGINFSLVDGKWKTTSPAWGHGWGSRRVVEAIGSYYRGGNDFGSLGGLPARDHVEGG